LIPKALAYLQLCRASSHATLQTPIRECSLLQWLAGGEGLNNDKFQRAQEFGSHPPFAHRDHLL
jgi:hypothetical protein